MARGLVGEKATMTHPRLGSRRPLAEVLCELGRVNDALDVLEKFETEAKASAPELRYGELAWVEAGCLRPSGRVEEAVAAIWRDVRIVQTSDDKHDLMLALEEQAAREEAAGDLPSALARAREVKRCGRSTRARRDSSFSKSGQAWNSSATAGASRARPQSPPGRRSRTWMAGSLSARRRRYSWASRSPQADPREGGAEARRTESVFHRVRLTARNCPVGHWQRGADTDLDSWAEVVTGEYSSPL